MDIPSGLREVYCDLNARMTEHGYSLERYGSVQELAKHGFTLDEAVGLSFIFYMDDANDSGNLDDIMFVGKVVRDDEYGVLAERDASTDFFWRSQRKDAAGAA